MARWHRIPRARANSTFRVEHPNRGISSLTERSISKPICGGARIDIDELDTEPGWTVVVDGAVVAIMKKLTAHQDASELRARIFQNLATEAQRELSDIWPVRALSDLDDRMPRFLHAFFGDLWRS